MAVAGIVFGTPNYLRQAVTLDKTTLMICGLSAVSILGVMLLQAAAARVLTLAMPPGEGEEQPVAEHTPPGLAPAPLKPTPAEAQPDPEQASDPEQQPTSPPDEVEGTRVFSPFDGVVDLIKVSVIVGDQVEAGQIVAQVEAMNGIHDVKAPEAGEVLALHVELGAEVDPDHPIMTIG